MRPTVVSVALAALSVGSVLASAPAAHASVHVVAIGNNLGRPGDPRLRYAERDAKQVADVLRRLAGVAPGDLTLVLGGDASEVRAALLRTNTGLRSAQSGGPPEHTLIVYYSGHADAAGLHLGDSPLPFSELRAMVESSSARIRILILDACRSGEITQMKGAKPAAPFTIQLEDRIGAEGFAILTSSAESEDSQESERLEASFFTHHLVNALRGAADRDRDRRITLEEVHAYTHRETLRSSSRTQEMQHPTYRWDLRGSGEVVLTRLPAGPGERDGVLEIGAPGAYLIFEGDEGGPISADLSVPNEGAALSLPPGRYFVQRRGKEAYREHDVELPPGARVVLDQQPFRELKYARLARKGGGPGASLGASLSGLVTGAGPGETGHGLGVLAAARLDLEWATATIGVRWTQASDDAGRALPTRIHELAVRLVLERHLDVHPLSLSLGPFVEGIGYRQTFRSRGLAPERSGFAAGFGLVAGAELELAAELSLRLEGGPSSRVARSEREGGRVSSALDGFAALGVVWRL